MSACACILLLALCHASAFDVAGAAAATPAASASSRNASVAAGTDTSSSRHEERTYLVPALEGASTKLSPGPRPFLHRVSFSPAYGKLGEQTYFAFRFAYSPNRWLGYEIGLGHNPAHSVHGLLHNLSAVLRYPVAFRIQPYANLGYGMLTVYPGRTINADPVTKNVFTYGGGLELYLRDDVAIRGEYLGTSVIGRDPLGPGSASYTYRQFTIGFSFYRSLGR